MNKFGLHASNLRTRLFSKIPVRERVYFNHRLALFLRSGVPIVAALRYIAEDASRARARELYLDISQTVAGGHTLATALNNHHTVFTTFDIALVRVGESSGRLHESLAYIAELVERARVLKARVMGALLYPAIILVATFGITLFLLLYAFPKILPLFRGFGGTLPLSTRILIGLTDGIARYGWILLSLAILMVLMFLWIDHKPDVRLLRHRFQLRIPIIGPMLQAHQLAVIAKVLGTLVKHGISLVQALELSGASIGNTAYQQLLRDTQARVLLGQRISDSFATSPNLFPTLATQIIRTGEMTGNLSEGLLQVAEIYEDVVRERSERIATLVEPILMIVTGIVVGFIALSIITPIYRITQDLTP